MSESRRSKRVWAGVLLVIVGPVLGAFPFGLGNYIGWIAALAFLLGWGVLSHRLILGAGARGWAAGIGALLAVVWAVMAPWILLILALSAGGFQLY